jgi:hypothetical protein
VRTTSDSAAAPMAAPPSAGLDRPRLNDLQRPKNGARGCCPVSGDQRCGQRRDLRCLSWRGIPCLRICHVSCYMESSQTSTKFSQQEAARTRRSWKHASWVTQRRPGCLAFPRPAVSVGRMVSRPRPCGSTRPARRASRRRSARPRLWSSPRPVSLRPSPATVPCRTNGASGGGPGGFSGSGRVRR